MDALLSAAQWVVGKALAPVADGVLGHWDASRDLGLNVDVLSTELLLVKATLETASRKQIGGQAMEELLRKLQDSARCADDLLDELDYFRIHDELHGTYDAANQHAKGGVHDLALNARHTVRAVACCPWPCARQRSRDTSSSSPNANQAEVTRCVPKLGKLLPCSSSPKVLRDNSNGQRDHAEETHLLGFNRVDASERMKQVVEQLQPARREFATILQSCDRITATEIAKSRPTTTSRSIEPKLYGRDHLMNSIIHDMTKGEHCGKDLTVLTIVGPGGIGKTTMMQHIYHNEEVQKHFQVVIWICVSLKFNLNKLIEEIKTNIPRAEGEKDGKAEEVIEQRLKSKRFLLLLDDIWEFSDGDDWKRLLLPLRKSQEKGSMVLLTTRFPVIAKMVKLKATDHSIELEGLEYTYFRELFHSFIFRDEPVRNDLLKTGDMIMEKLKGSPLAAKTVGALLRKGLNLRHWRRVLESREWERQSAASDIMPALKLSYDYLPFHQQQCFSFSALFPEDHKYSTNELINLWIGLDILQPNGQNKTLKDTGLSNLNDLVTHGFFREEETDVGLHYVMHDLLHDLALNVTSHECMSISSSNVGSVEIQPSTRHLSINIDVYDKVSRENFKYELRKLNTRLKVKKLHTLMLFGVMDESFASIFSDLFREASSLRILHLVYITSSVESILHIFSTLVHLRYLYLGTNKYGKYWREIHLPLGISRFYHLRILDLGSWYQYCDLPKDLSNLAKLCHFYTQRDELHSHILNVGKLVLLEELKVFRVNQKSEGFEPKQLEHLSELRELGIYNLENIKTKEEAAKAKLLEKKYMEKLTLDWDSKRSNIEPDVEVAVLESLQPHPYLEELCIRGHGGPSCPTWMGDELAVEALESLHLDGVSWQCLPSLGKMWGLRKVILKHIATMEEFVIEQSFCRLIRIELVGLESFKKWVPSHDAHMFPLLQVLVIRDCPILLELPFSHHIAYPKRDQGWNIDWFPKLQDLEIKSCPEFMVDAHIPWTETLRSVNISNVKLLENFRYSSKPSSIDITGKDDLQSLTQLLPFSNLACLQELTLMHCPPLELKHLVMLPSLKKLRIDRLDGLVGPLKGEGDVQWQLPIEELKVGTFRGEGSASGKELTELLSHLPRLASLVISGCKHITRLAVTAEAPEVEKQEDGLLLLPTYLSDSLRDLSIFDCPELVLGLYPSTFLHVKGDGHQALRSLLTLYVMGSPEFQSSMNLFSWSLFPSLQTITLHYVEGMGTLEPFSNLTSLAGLTLTDCGKDLRCKGLGHLLTIGGHLTELCVLGSPRFFDGWDPNPSRVLLLEDAGGGGEEKLVFQPKLQRLNTDDAMGLLATPICSLLSSSLTKLQLNGNINYEVEGFTKEQEDALHLLTSLHELEFVNFIKLEHLPAGLHKLTKLKRLFIFECQEVRSLPKDGLPKSLQQLDVYNCGNRDLKQQCRGLVGTIPNVRLKLNH